MPHAPSEQPSQSPALTGTVGHALGVKWLSLTEFRNYRDQTLEFDGPIDRPVVLAGPNGAGKTNLLEAISYLCPGRGLRGARLGEIGRRETGRRVTVQPWAVAAVVDGMQGEARLGTGLQPGGQTPDADVPQADRRIARIDGEASRPALLGHHLAIIWLTPRMDRLFMDGAGDRRRFFDRLVLALHPEHGRRISAYERSLRERVRLLDSGADPVWLGALERRIAENAVAISAARIDTLDHLAHQIGVGSDGENSATDFPRAGVRLEGEVEGMLRERSALEVEDWLVASLANNRQNDARQGRTGLGPHLSDLIVDHQARDMPARLCSTGEQKALLIGLVLAHAAMMKAASGAQPILLLDEIAAHLDADRRLALFDALAALRCQVWMTGTDFQLFEGLEHGAMRLTVTAGSVRPA